jgi:hypothetical protein
LHGWEEGKVFSCLKSIYSKYWKQNPWVHSPFKSRQSAWSDLPVEPIIRVSRIRVRIVAAEVVARSRVLKKNICAKLGPGRACKMRARVGLGLYTAGSGFILRAQAFMGLAWPGLQARSLECRLGPKIGPMLARAFGLCSKARAWARPGLYAKSS